MAWSVSVAGTGNISDPSYSAYEQHIIDLVQELVADLGRLDGGSITSVSVTTDTLGVVNLISDVQY